MDRYIEKELKEGAIIGSFKEKPFTSKVMYSPMTSTEKKDSMDRRVVMDLRFPPDRSVNSMIPKSVYLGAHMRLRYLGVDDLVEQFIW